MYSYHDSVKRWWQVLIKYLMTRSNWNGNLDIKRSWISKWHLYISQSFDRTIHSDIYTYIDCSGVPNCHLVWYLSRNMPWIHHNCSVGNPLAKYSYLIYNVAIYCAHICHRITYQTSQSFWVFIRQSGIYNSSCFMIKFFCISELGKYRSDSKAMRSTMACYLLGN